MIWFIGLCVVLSVIVLVRFIMIRRFYERVFFQFEGFMFLLEQAHHNSKSMCPRFIELSLEREKHLQSLFGKPLLIALDLTRVSYDQWVENLLLWEEMNAIAPYNQIVLLRVGSDQEED